MENKIKPFDKQMSERYAKIISYAPQGTTISVSKVESFLKHLDEYKELAENYIAFIKSVPYSVGEPAIIKDSGATVIVNSMDITYNKETTNAEILTVTITNKDANKSKIDIKHLAPYSDASKVLYGKKDT